MSKLDIFISIIFLYNCTLGITKGLLKSLFGILSFVIASVFAPLFQNFATNIILKYINNDINVVKFLGFGFSWFIIYITANIIFTIIIKNMENTPIKSLDRMAGLLLGIFISAVIVIVPSIFIDILNLQKYIPQVKDTVTSSKLLPYFEPIKKPFENIFQEILKEKQKEIIEIMSNKKI